MAKKPRQPRRGICGYCGKDGVVTRDHVIPRCMFDLENFPKIQDFVIIDACLKCNSEKGLNDDYLRDVIVSDGLTEGNAEALSLLSTKFKKSFTRDSSLIAREHAKSLDSQIQHFTCIFDEYGNITYGIEDEHDMSRIGKVVDTIVRGLYFHLVSQVMPERSYYELEKNLLHKGNALELCRNAGFEPAGVIDIGKGRFRCHYQIKDDGVTAWLFAFFGCVFVFLRSHPEITAAPITAGLNSSGRQTKSN